MIPPLCSIHGIPMTQDDPPLGAPIQSWCQFACRAPDCRKIVFLCGDEVRRWVVRSMAPLQIWLPWEVEASA
jgi:hypothetical protein